MLRVLSLILTIVIIGGGLILITGYTTLPSYVDEVTFEVQYSPQLTWQELLNIGDMTRRKADVVNVDILEEYGKLIAWQENLKNGGYRIYRMNEREEGRKLVLELTDSSYGLTGIWTFELVPVGADTQITILEKSTLSNFMRRGYRVYFGRNHDLLVWEKYIKVGLIQGLLTTP